jgi:general secretion pathway protein D
VRSEIVLAITPRIVRNLAVQTPEARNIFSGTSNVPREKPILAEPISQLKFSQPPGVSTPGTVPAAPSSPSGPAAPVGQPLSPSPAGPVLFNPLPAPPTGSQPPGVDNGGAMLPTPPAMYVRPPPNR